MEKAENKEEASNVQSTEDSDEESDEDGKLQISLTPVRTIGGKANARKRKRIQSASEEEEIDEILEDKLQDCARKNNLSSLEMKKLLRSVVKNDHVLALVKIQEEAELALEKGKNGSDTNEKNGESHTTPKFTRSTARALNQKPLPIGPLSEIQPGPEIAALITEDLHSDEDDEEYQPREEEYASDDDPNATVSDFDSQPCTPMTPATQGEPEDDLNQSQYTDDGLFKVPRHRKDSVASHPDEIIAKRTRSKVCLQETPIEAIESNFIPPDITTDMYDFDMEIDNAWKEFLTNFSKPLNPNAEEDDEADPEYVAADHEPIDSEELKDVNISKKELNDLVAELFDGLIQEGVILEDIQLGSPKKNLEKSPQKKKTKPDTKSDISSPVNDTRILRSSGQFNHMVEPHAVALRAQSEANRMSCSRKETINTTLIDTEESHLNTTRMNQTNFSPYIVSTPNNSTKQKIESELNVAIASILPSNKSDGSFGEVSQLYVREMGENSSTSMPVQLLFASTVSSMDGVDAGAGGGSQGVITLIPVTLAYSSPGKNVFTVVPVTSTSNTFPTSVTSICESKVPPKPTNTESEPIILVDSGDNCIGNSSAIMEMNNQSVPYMAPNNVTASTANISTVTVTQPTENITSVAVAPQSTSKTITISDTVTKQTATSKTCKNSKYMPPLRRSRENPPRIASCFREIHITNEPTFVAGQRGFTELQRQLLEQNLRMHIQFIAQSFFQTYCHPIFWKYASTLKDMLMEFDKHYSSKPRSIYNICNLKSAVKLITDWEAELSVNNRENTALMELIYYEVDRAKKYSQTARFPPRIMNKMIRSPAFVYGHLLPFTPFKPYESTYLELIPAVDQLLAHSLDFTFKELDQYEKRIRPENPCRVALSKTCRYIGRTGFYNKSAKRLHEYIRKRMHDTRDNAIKFYFKNNRPPPYKYILYDVDLNHIPRLQDRLAELPPVWKECAIKLRAIEYQKKLKPKSCQQSVNSTRGFNDREVEVFTPNCTAQNASNITIHLNCVYDSQQNNTSISTYNSYSAPSGPESYQINQTLEIPKHETPTAQIEYPYYFTKIHEPIPSLEKSGYYDVYKYGKNFDSTSESPSSSVNSTPAPSCEVAKANKSSSVSQVIDENLPPPAPTTSAPSTISAEVPQQPLAPAVPKGQKLLTDYFAKVQKFLSDKESKGVLNRRRHNRKLKILKAQRQNRHFKKILLRRIVRKKYLKRKIKRLLRSYRNSLRCVLKTYENDILNTVYVAVKSLEIYTEFLSDLSMLVRKMKTPEECTTRKSTIAKVAGDDEMPKTRKPYRVGESLRQMLLPESKEDANEKDAVFAMNFFDKVEETLCSAGHHERYEKFQKILKSFNCRKDRAAELYQKMENLFMPEYPQLAEIFLAFLLPSEAIEIGKFFEHFMITNMGNFINKLNIFFNKQPAQIKKIYGALNELAEEKDVDMEQIRNKILPLLKGNKFLIDWFLQNFGSEKPNPSISNVYETINLKQLESQQGEGEIYETVQQKDIIEESTENNPCQLKYINGGIYYGSRILLPAKLSFLATELSKFEEEEETTADDTGTIEANKPCVHGIRDYAERQLKSHLDKCDEETKVEEEDEKDKDKYTLCDDNTFKAHAARLNPALYQVPQHHHISTSLKSKYSEGEMSPKKQCLQKRRSPKKNLPKSPTATNKKSSGSNATISESSKAVGIAKRLKSMTNGGDNEPQSSIKSKRKQQKPHKTTSGESSDVRGSHINSDGVASDSDKSASQCEPKRKQVKLQLTTSSEDLQSPGPSSQLSTPTQIETICSSSCPSPVEEKVSVWTRDEDKIILEEVKSGYDCENNLVARIMAKLPHRNENEITNRHQFLMEVLTQLQGKTS